MNIIWMVLAGYFLLGLLAIVLLDLATGRVRRSLADASYETQNKMIQVGEFVGRKTAMVLTIGALWLFWPVAIYGAFTEGKDGQKG